MPTFLLLYLLLQVRVLYSLLHQPKLGMVNQTARTLAGIARQLTSDYVGFEEIVSEIDEAAGSVEKATTTLDDAIKVLLGSFP